MPEENNIDNPVDEPKNPFEKAMGELVARVKKFETDLEAKVQDQLAEIEEKGEAHSGLGEELTEQKNSIEALKTQLEEMRLQTHSVFDGDLALDVKSVGEDIKEDEKLVRALELGSGFRGTVSVPVPNGLFTPERKTLMEEKTTITSATVGSATSGILVPQRVRDYVPAAQRRFTLRDLIPSRPTSQNAVEFPQENAFTNAASPQTEGSAKAESALTFTITNVPIRTIAHWIPATAQVLDDWASLQRIINNKLMYGLKLKEEMEILTGDNLGSHLNGLITQATAYAGTYDVGSDTNLDTLRWAILEAEDDDEEVDFIVLNPVNFYTILGIKDETNGANTGNYIVGNPVAFGAAQPVNIWGKRLVVTNTMTSGAFLVGTTQQCEIFDRMQASVMISTEHEEYFTKNMVAIRVEERIALAVYRTTPFIYGSF